MKSVDVNGIGMTSKRTRGRLIQRLIGQGIYSEAVLNIIESTPRHLFVDEALSHRAYEDTALPIGHNQTLSQPYVVARMTEALLAAGPLNKVLEIGTGSGYQTAILASLVKHVYSVERIKGLHDKARSRLRALSYSNARLQYSDGSVGWGAVAPFDGIIVTAAPVSIPDKLLAQLSPEGGRMVIPVGDKASQDLVVVTRNGEQYRRHSLEQVRFVPMVDDVV